MTYFSGKTDHTSLKSTRKECQKVYSSPTMPTLIPSVNIRTTKSDEEMKALRKIKDQNFVSSDVVHDWNLNEHSSSKETIFMIEMICKLLDLIC